jgi:hypothetical protein
MAEKDKVEFRQGNSNELPKGSSGTFYFTMDKDELYFSKYDGNLTYIGSPFHVGDKEPSNTHLLWIHTNSKQGGLKYYNGTSWVHVPVAFTAMPNETPEAGGDDSVQEEAPNFEQFVTTNGTIIGIGSNTWKAESNGWYLVEIFGASGDGGLSACEL